MLGFLKNSSKKDTIILVLDIGSGSVGGAIVKIPVVPASINEATQKSVLPVILKSTRVDIKVAEKVEFEKLLLATEKALTSVIKTLHNSTLGVPEKAYCTLSSPWYSSDARIVKNSREHSFVFTQRMADDLFNKEISNVTASYQNKYDMNSAPEIIEHHITSVTANGHPTRNPIGITTKSIEMSILVSVSPQVFLEYVRNAVSAVYSEMPVAFSSFAVSSFIAVSHRYVDTESFILLDVAGNITDLSIVSNGSFKTSISFPFGKSTLLKHVARALEIEVRDAEELCNLYVAGILDQSKLKKVEPALQAAEEAWEKLFRESIESVRTMTNVPDTIFLTADTDALPWFKSIINGKGYFTPITRSQKWKVVTLDGPQFFSMCNVVDGPCDPFLMIEAISIMRTLYTQYA
jgi:hypothetical protein